MFFKSRRLMAALSGCALLCGCANFVSTERGGIYRTYGDSITSGVALVHPTTEAYPVLVGLLENAAVENHAIGGDQACDLATRQIFPHRDDPTLSTRYRSSVLIGTNDQAVKGEGPYEAVFQLCHQAVVSWLAIPAESKVLAVSSVVTAKGGGKIDRTKNWNAWTTSAAGASVSFPITLPAEGPIYAWPRIRDDNPAIYTYSLDGAIAGTATTQTTPRINTQNGSKESLGFLRFPSVAPGKHVVTFTQTSAGPDGVSIVGIGTPAGVASVTSPSVLVGAIPYQFGNGRCNAVSYAPCLAYTLVVEADLALFSADGLKIRLFDPRQYLAADATDMYDAYHPNALGHIEMSHAIEAVW